MVDKNFILQRICIYVGKDINPDSDIQVKEALYRIGIKLPQKRTVNESLEAASSEHEVISLLMKYRTLS
ncbi:hypothetical protein [Aliikangiella sp. IMCC44359]|uniref:hypothetical protein n=1 Tax=Aliikangiella sp. IMCC44359 TaxID=3459125 RepID=UPI00403B18DB